jgi:hypothetical protein
MKVMVMVKASKDSAGAFRVCDALPPFPRRRGASLFALRQSERESPGSATAGQRIRPARRLRRSGQACSPVLLPFSQAPSSI